jgi:hypothetical protein
MNDYIKNAFHQFRLWCNLSRKKNISVGYSKFISTLKPKNHFIAKVSSTLLFLFKYLFDLNKNNEVYILNYDGVMYVLERNSYDGKT